MDNLDETLRAAMKALDDRAPARPDYFEGMSDSIEARLAGERDAQGVPMENLTTEGGHDAEGMPPRAQPNDDSGLHDIKALAKTTRQRVSKRITSQHDIDESLLSSSQSGLRAVALPEPAKLVSLPSIEQLADAAPAVARAAEKVAARPQRRSPRIWIAGSAIAAAAALAAVVVIGSSSGSKGSEESRAAASGPASPNAGAAMGSAANEAVPPPPSRHEDRAVIATGKQTAADNGAMANVGAGRGSAAAAGSGSGSALEQGTLHTTSTDAPPGGGAGHSNDKNRDGGKVPVDLKHGGKDGQAGGTTVVKDKHKPGDPKSLDDLIDEAAGGGGTAKKPAAGDTTKATLDKKELTSSDIRTGMGSVSKRAQACFDKFGVSGTVGVKATVAPSGQITKVSATGGFAGTPTGDCVASAVSSVSFPAWDGPPMTINYSYLLSE